MHMAPLHKCFGREKRKIGVILTLLLRPGAGGLDTTLLSSHLSNPPKAVCKMLSPPHIKVNHLVVLIS